MVAFIPEELPLTAAPVFEEELNDDGRDTTVPKPGRAWVPMWRHDCTFGPEIFADKMMNLIRNPNLNSSWLFRADILYDDGPNDGTTSALPASSPVPCNIKSMTCQRTLVRKMIPRNERRDEPLEQTCSFYQSTPSVSSPLSTLVLYIPHASTAAEIPFYHPIVRGIAHLHEWDTATETGTVSVHFLPYPDHPLLDDKLRRTAYHLLQIVHKHGHSSAAGYVKRVNHDVVISQPRFQNRYALLKSKYARSLVESWAETTDPEKHVFEDLGIAAFLLELWNDMYTETPFPGFVDIGCGNGLLVYILIQEGYSGWGFDARRRRSWETYALPCSDSSSGSSLEERLLLPSVVPHDSINTDLLLPTDTHDGIFPPGTFIISNHADELTPWTPILATISQCPFIMIPCCSHNLTGEKYRAPPPKDKTKSRSTFASLVDWVTQIAQDCGWEVETEMLRIPSTRNTGLLGRSRTTDAVQVDIQAVLVKYGGVEGYFANVAKLIMKAPRSH